MRYLLLIALTPCLVWGAPSRYQQKSQEEFAIKQELTRLWNEVRNHEADIAKLKNHIATQDETIEDLREELERERRKSPAGKSREEIEEEIAKLQKHSELLTDAINGDKDAIARMQKAMQNQDGNLSHMQKAVESIMNALGLKNEVGNPPGNWYTVKSGDSLGSIAMRHHTTVDDIKRSNQLKNDRIFVGQKIRLP